MILSIVQRKSKAKSSKIFILELYLQPFFSGPNFIYEESHFYNTTARLLQHVYDICVVWPFKNETDELASGSKLVSYYPY